MISIAHIMKLDFLFLIGRSVLGLNPKAICMSTDYNCTSLAL